ncbi:biotin transporter BioY [Rhabdaerophilum sp. SD176]|uniref:biotin transporter BioY n=1 Tax=Rhabdaerophilum sp. SD176 TaxID=2983548 RepID=UPI0024DF4EF6|nr:biotin transporter BioY [Rhabdaerophilum sp. SD176]
MTLHARSSLAHAAMPVFRFEGDYTLLRKAAAIFAGSILLALCSWISVPMIPVPMTMQTYGILLLGVLLGWRLAGASVLLYLAEALAGLPVLAGGAFGLKPFLGPTAGYLAAFPLAAMLVGWCVERGWARHVLSAFMVMLAAHAVIFAGGLAWLATFTGMEKAIAVGLMPFLVGTVIKSALVVATGIAFARAKGWHR